MKQPKNKKYEFEIFKDHWIRVLNDFFDSEEGKQMACEILKTVIKKVKKVKTK